MTLRTKDRDIRREGRRVWTQLPEYKMCAVTFLARRSVGIIFRSHLPMRADLILLGKLSVTGRAIDFLRDRFAWTKARNADLGMALAARGFRVT